MKAQSARRRPATLPPPPLKKSQWPELCRHARALNDGLVRAGLVTPDIGGPVTQADVAHIIDELDKTLEIAVGEMDCLLAFMERLRVLGLHAVSVRALVMLAVTPALVAVMAGSCLWMALRGSELSVTRLAGDAVLISVFVLGAGGSGVAILAYRWLAPETLDKIHSNLYALTQVTKRDASSNFETVCDICFSLSLAYEVPDVRQQFCQVLWVAAAALLGLELLFAWCRGSVLTFACIVLGCVAQALITGAAAIVVAPRGPMLDYPPGCTMAERTVARMGRSPLFAAAAAAVVAGFAPAIEKHLGLSSTNMWVEERLRNLRTVIKELHLTRRSVIKAARSALDKSGDWGIRGSIGGLTAGVTSGVSIGVESVSSGVTSIAQGASSLLFG